MGEPDLQCGECGRKEVPASAEARDWLELRRHGQDKAGALFCSRECLISYANRGALLDDEPGR